MSEKLVESSISELVVTEQQFGKKKESKGDILQNQAINSMYKLLKKLYQYKEKQKKT